MTLAPQAVDDKTTEVFAIEDLLAVLMLKSRIMTVDALHTQRFVAQTILDWDADCILLVKENHPEILTDIQLLFQEPTVVADTLPQAESLDPVHGRIERRVLIASTALTGYLRWAGLQQVFRLERTVSLKKSDKKRHEVVYGIASFAPDRADAARLLRLVRQHWYIENKSHQARDVTFDEDRSQVRRGAIPQMMAALRNVAIGLIRLSRQNNIAAGPRRFAVQPWAAVALLGIKSEN